MGRAACGGIPGLKRGTWDTRGDGPDEKVVVLRNTRLNTPSRLADLLLTGAILSSDTLYFFHALLQRFLAAFAGGLVVAAVAQALG